jgi:DNA-binding NarL/FixJ family response regulator
MRSVLSTKPAFEVLVFDHGEPGYEQLIEENRPDVLLVDAKLPDGLAVEVTRFVLNHVGRGKVLLLGSADCEETIVECLAVGAQGCVLEQSSLTELQDALEKVYHGEPYCSPVMMHSMLRQLAETTCQPRWLNRARSIKLTFREQEVLQLIASHLSNKEIGKRLSISVYTVKNHVHNIVEKLQVESRYEAVEYARQRNWLAPVKPR